MNTALLTDRTVLLQAADLIEANGKAEGDFYIGRRLCAEGAISCAVFHDPAFAAMFADRDPRHDDPQLDLWAMAMDLLELHLEHTNDPTWRRTHSVAAWSDAHNQAHVVDALRAAATEKRGVGDA